MTVGPAGPTAHALDDLLDVPASSEVMSMSKPLPVDVTAAVACGTASGQKLIVGSFDNRVPGQVTLMISRTLGAWAEGDIDGDHCAIMVLQELARVALRQRGAERCS
jgi:hypothetical protein